MTSATIRLAVAPPLLTPDGQLRFTTTPANWLVAEDVTTGTVLWTLALGIPVAASSARWRVLPSDDGVSVYVHSLSDEQGLTYHATLRLNARTGDQLATDRKMEIYWFENVVLWMALRSDGKLLMAVQRPRGAGYWVRTLDPQTLRVIADVQHPGPPAIPGQQPSGRQARPFRIT